MNKQTRVALPRHMPFVSMGADVPGGASQFSLKAIFGAIRRRFWLGLLSFLLIFLAIAAYTLQKTPVYTAQVRIVLDTQSRDVVDLGSMFSGLAPNTALIDTELEVIKSEAMLSRVVDKLNLTQYQEFNYTMQEVTGLQAVMANIRKKASGLLANARRTEGEEAAVILSGEERQAAIRTSATNRLKRAITVRRLGPTYAIDIAAESVSPSRAAQIANTVADQYLVNQLEAKLESARRANDWLSERLSSLKDEVNDKESAVEAYRAESGLLIAEGTTLTEQEIADLTRERTLREAELAEAEARLTNVRSRINSGSTDTISEVLGSQVVSDLRRQQAEIQRRRADLLTRYGPRHPDVQTVNNELSDVRAQIDAETSRIVGSLESEVNIARSRVNSFNRRLGQARSRLANNNRANVKLRELEREADSSRILYEDFLERFKKSTKQDDLAKADARILSLAEKPAQPSSPNIPMSLLLGLMLAGATSAGLIMLAELRENHFSSGEEIERAFNVLSIGSIPMLTGRGRRSPADYAVENPISAFSESMRNLRASIVFADLDNPAKTVAICSSLPNEGKTMTTFSLGRMSALSGSRTLIIDGDFRRRQLTEAAGLEPKAGLIEHLFGEVSLEDVIEIDEASGAHVLPLTSTRNTPRDVFGSRAFDTLLERLREAYDLIVIDTGPILLMAESRIVVSKVDQVIVIAKWRSTTRTALSQTLAILHQFNASIAGVALNFVDYRKRRFLSNSGASYKAYRKYYSEGPAA